MKYSKLKPTHALFIKIRALEKFLIDNELTIEKPANPQNGLIINGEDISVTLLEESNRSDLLPSDFECSYAICDTYTGNLKEI